VFRRSRFKGLRCTMTSALTHRTTPSRSLLLFELVAAAQIQARGVQAAIGMRGPPGGAKKMGGFFWFFLGSPPR